MQISEMLKNISGFSHAENSLQDCQQSHRSPEVSVFLLIHGRSLVISLPQSLVSLILASNKVQEVNIYSWSAFTLNLLIDMSSL